MKSIKPYILFIVSMLIVSCGNSKLKGYEWIEGTWEMHNGENWAKVTISQSDYTVDWNIYGSTESSKNPIVIGKVYNYYQDREMLALDTTNLKIGIDESAKCIFIAMDEYSTFELTNDKLLSDTKNVTSSKTIDNNQKRKLKKSNSSIEKAWIRAYNQNEYLYFSTNYSDFELPYYMVFHPFVFSENGLRGICYFVSYGETDYYKELTAKLHYYGEYELVGEYLRISNIIQDRRRDKYIKPRIYKVSIEDGRLQLTGRFINTDANINTNTQILGSVPNLIIKLIERESICLHK